MDLNATQAAIRAGYSEKSAARIAVELLNKTQVSAALQKQQAKLQNKLEITQEKGGEEVTSVHQIKLPYDMDGVIINLPGYLADLPQEAYLSEFVPTVEEYDESAEETPSGDEFELGDI